MAQVTVVDHPLVQHKLTWMRREDTPSPVFRQLLSEIALLLTYELTRTLPLERVQIRTPLVQTEAPVLAGPPPVLISILRAGNGLLDGMLQLLPTASVGHVGLYRNEETLEPVEYYLKVPRDLGQRPTLVVDPMLATGQSAIAAITMLKGRGAVDLRFLCLLAAPEGIAAFTEAHPDVPVVTAAIDDHLNERGYIVPGLGDAGDRIYGTP
ncbi:MAG TPA: uracil phosphoribosyltransferase [Deltaproteobacteria bacterium]|nr:uracil phosphoribosyltransferase [Deltaproteobacteria bacterium]